MNHELFVTTLATLAQLKTSRPPRTAARRESTETETVIRQGHTVDLTLEHNPTHHVEIVRILHEPRACEDCGKQCTDRRTVRGRYISPRPHWRTWCGACGCFRNPRTGQFDLSSSQAQSFFVQWFNKE